MLERVCEELIAEKPLDDPEEFERLKNSVKLLSDWLGKGMEVYATVQSAPEVKAVFVPIERQSLTSEAIKMLTAGNGAEAE